MSDQQYLEALWAKHIEVPSEDTMEQLVIAYVPLARYLAQRALAKAPPHQDREDILSYAHHGLLDAINRFEPGLGFKFETYASRRIAGAIIDGQRRQDPLSRSMRKRVKELERVIREIQDVSHRDPEPAEIALLLGTDEAEVRYLQIARQSLNSSINLLMEAEHGGESQLHSLHVGSGTNGSETETEIELRMAEISDMLAPLLARLSDRERAFVVYHYCERLTLREVARRLGLHETRTGQLRTEIMRSLAG